MFAASKSGSAVAKDPKFPYVTMLLHGDGTNGGQNNTFLDSSTNNFTITRNGNTTQGTFTPYGSNWSNYFATSYLDVASNVAFAFGTGDFTIECWSCTMASGRQDWFDLNNGTSANRIQFLFDGTNVAYYNNGTLITGAAYTPTIGAWTHYALVRVSGSAKVFVNGTQLGTSGSNTTNFSANPVRIAHDDSISNYVTGYISNARIVKGTAVYTTTFTPPTAPLTAISGTSLLTCQSNRFIDNSTNAFAITVNGSPSVQRFSPFAPSAAYSTSVIGGSGYFDGSGDYLTAPNSTAFDLSTSDFTLEGFFYPTVGSAFQSIFAYASNAGASVSDYAFQLLLNNTNGVNFRVVASGSSSFTTITTSNTITLNSWNYVCVTRTGTSVSVYLNGTTTTGTIASTIRNNASSILTIGRDPDGTYAITGYLSNLRILKGTAVTPSTPTAPLTAITNTSLLLSNTNASILDNAMMNDLETVGNAQISTSVKKYGTGSMYFDGSSNIVFNGSNTAVFGTGDFTIEFWAYVSNAALSGNFLDMRPALTNGSYPNIYYSSSSLGYYVGGVDRITGGTISSNTWFHVAVCRSGTSTKMFLNGTQVGSTYTDTTNYLCGTTRPMIGGNGYLGSSNLTGYIDEYRFSKYARYTANFTPPTAAFPNN